MSRVLRYGKRFVKDYLVNDYKVLVGQNSLAGRIKILAFDFLKKELLQWITK